MEYKNIGFNQIAKQFPDLVIAKFEQSAVENTNIFREIIEKIKPKIVIEIGTFHGIGTTVLASIADFVYTFDIKELANTDIWDCFNVRNKIEYIICSKGREKIKKYKSRFCVYRCSS